MEDMRDRIAQLEQELIRKDEIISNLKTEHNTKSMDQYEALKDGRNTLIEDDVIDKLSNKSIARYSRQLILPEIGVKGQLKLMRGSVLIIGAGGLGCPAAVYLAAAGIGRIGIVDYDEVELNNLHRQILHSEKKIGVSKSSSAAHACHQLNSEVRCIPYHISLDSQNALKIINQYDVVLDCTDNVATRYLLNDACVLTGKPLVSGSALRFEGQLTVYNYQNGPCYRCLYPKPPPPETVTNCSDGGVLGVVPGIIGTIQALEAIKIIRDIGSTFSQRLLLFDALDGTFRTIKLRAKQTACLVCSSEPTITKLIDYVQFCGAPATDKIIKRNLLESHERITVKEYKRMLDEKKFHLLVDTRPPVELDICQLPHEAMNIAFEDFSKDSSIVNLNEKILSLNKETCESFPVIVVCKNGNDSQIAVIRIKEKLKELDLDVKDISGGLTAWAKQVDPEFPVY